MNGRSGPRAAGGEQTAGTAQPAEEGPAQRCLPSAPLIRDVPDEVVAAFDSRLARQGVTAPSTDRVLSVDEPVAPRAASPHASDPATIRGARRHRQGTRGGPSSGAAETRSRRRPGRAERARAPVRGRPLRWHHCPQWSEVRMSDHTYAITHLVGTSSSTRRLGTASARPVRRSPTWVHEIRAYRGHSNEVQHYQVTLKPGFRYDG